MSPANKPFCVNHRPARVMAQSSFGWSGVWQMLRAFVWVGFVQPLSHTMDKNLVRCYFISEGLHDGNNPSTYNCPTIHSIPYPPCSRSIICAWIVTISEPLRDKVTEVFQRLVHSRKWIKAYAKFDLKTSADRQTFVTKDWFLDHAKLDGALSFFF